MAEIIEGVKALAFDPELVSENVSVDNSRAVKVSTLFVEKIASLYAKKTVTSVNTEVVEKEEEYQEPVYVSDTYTESTVDIDPVVTFEKEEEQTEEVEPTVSYEEEEKEEEVTPVVTEAVHIADPDGMLLDIASSFESAVAQINERQKEVERREGEIDKIRDELISKEEKTSKLLDELEKMKKDVEETKKEADKIIRNAEVSELALKKRIDAFEEERQKFLNNLKITSSSIMNMVDKK